MVAGGGGNLLSMWLFGGACVHAVRTQMTTSAPTTAQYGPAPPTTYHMAALDWLGALGSPVNDQPCLMVSEPATTDERPTYVHPHRSWLGDVVSSYTGRLLSFLGRAAQPRPRKELAH